MEPNLYNNVPTNFSDLPKRKNTKIYVLVLAIVFVLVVISVVFYKQGIWPKKEVVNLPPAPQYTKANLPVDKLSEIFPKNLIQEENLMVLKSYQAEIKSERKTEYNLKYITQKTVTENFEAYKKYFEKNYWIIVSKDQKDNFAMIRATKNVAKSNDLVIFTHNVDQVGNIQTVDLTFTRSSIERYASTTNQSIN